MKAIQETVWVSTLSWDAHLHLKRFPKALCKCSFGLHLTSHGSKPSTAHTFGSHVNRMEENSDVYAVIKKSEWLYEYICRRKDSFHGTLGKKTKTRNSHEESLACIPLNELRNLWRSFLIVWRSRTVIYLFAQCAGEHVWRSGRICCGSPTVQSWAKLHMPCSICFIDWSLNW